MDNVAVMKTINKIKRRMLLGKRLTASTTMTAYSGYFYEYVKPSGGWEIKQIVQKVLLEAEQE